MKLKFDKRYLFYIMVFCFLTLLLIMMPPVVDRLMEGRAYYDLESPWRYILTLLRKIKICNTRIFCDILSAIVDRNIYIRAIFNSGMLLGTSWLAWKLSKGGDLPCLISVVVIFLVSQDVKVEVYYYATTLFVSAWFLYLFTVYMIIRSESISIANGKTFGIYILILITATWIENISFGLMMTLGGGVHMEGDR